MAGKPRGFESIRDMVLSMLVVGAVAFGLYAVVAWQRPEVQGAVRPAVDTAGVVDAVRKSGSFQVLEPAGLPDGWSATSAWYQDSGSTGALAGSVLHVGYTTPTGSYAEVRQTDGDPTYAVSEWADGGAVVGTVGINGQQWQRLESQSSGTKALTRTVVSRTHAEPSAKTFVLVTGKADWPELEQLAAALK